MIVVHINSSDINWGIIRIHPDIEYLLRLGKAGDRINTIDNPINQIRIINGR